MFARLTKRLKGAQVTDELKEQGIEIYGRS